MPNINGEVCLLKTTQKMNLNLCKPPDQQFTGNIEDAGTCLRHQRVEIRQIQNVGNFRKEMTRFLPHINVKKKKKKRETIIRHILQSHVWTSFGAWFK